jgi:hypothetical protein
MDWYKRTILSQDNRYLYHATYKALLPKIQVEGLRSPVFLAQNKYQAESFAEIGMDVNGLDKDIPEEWFDEIVILSISINDLDTNFLKIDHYNREENSKNHTFIYESSIPPGKLII